MTVHVHICNLAAQTGASLFLHTHAPPYPAGLDIAPSSHSADWVYNKTEHLTPKQVTASHSITHVIAELTNERAANTFAATGFPKEQWRQTAVIPAYAGLNIRKDAALALADPLGVVALRYTEQLAILERK